MFSFPKIAIIGAGPGGLTLGILLHKHNIPFTIYEKRNKPTDHELSQFSGMFELHNESDILALKQCGIYDDFLLLTGECSPDFLIADRTGTVHYNYNDWRGEDGSVAAPRVEISRNNLTKLLLSNIPSGSIKWGHELVSASPPSSSPGVAAVTLTFKTHEGVRRRISTSVDLALGADGPWSKVRSSIAQLYDQRIQDYLEPVHYGMNVIILNIREISTRYPHLRALLGTGTFCSLGNRHAVYSQRGAADSARVYLWMSDPYPYLEEFSPEKHETRKWTLPSSFKDTLVTTESLFESYGPLMKDLITTAFEEQEKYEGKVELRPLYSMPYSPLGSQSFTWPHTPGMTLLGDAAHVVPVIPNGEGVNAAMLDALVLVEDAILPAWRKMEAASHNSAGKEDKVQLFNEAVDPLLKQYEEKLTKRARDLAIETRGREMIMFDEEDTVEEFVGYMRG
ncbi:putative salicylate hydroxylase protein [Naviculisporaceae sp. PSN 640]